MKCCVCGKHVERWHIISRNAKQHVLKPSGNILDWLYVVLCKTHRNTPKEQLMSFVMYAKEIKKDQIVTS